MATGIISKEYGYINRRSIRLKGFDYRTPNAYFVTMCVNNRKCIFGDIVNNEICLNQAGYMVIKWYFELQNKFPGIECDEYVVMPNHFHCIIAIEQTEGRTEGQTHRSAPIRVGANLRVRPENVNVRPGNENICPDIPGIVQWFKTMTTNEYIRNVKQYNWKAFNKKLWQRNYYEHIIRNERALNNIRQYITDNPAKWAEDKNNPGNAKAMP